MWSRVVTKCMNPTRITPKIGGHCEFGGNQRTATREKCMNPLLITSRIDEYDEFGGNQIWNT